MRLTVRAGSRLSGAPQLPGDKSITHRALFSSALAKGESELHGLNICADCLSTLQCLVDLGAEIELNGTGARVSGRGLFGLEEPENVLDAGNSGTTLRILPGILAPQAFFSVISGDASLRRRPMDRIINPLRLMGGQIWGRAGGTRAPISSWGSELGGMRLRTAVASAQVKSALIYAGVLAEGQTVIEEPAPSRDHTERMLSYMGAEITVEEGVVSVTGRHQYQAARLDIPADISAAAFFLVGAALIPGSEVVLQGVGANPGRIGVVEALKAMGARIEILEGREQCNEPVVDLLVRSSQDAPRLKAIEIGADQVPAIIDELPILAVAATQAEGETHIRGAAELRVKESDRIAVLAGELRRLGAQVEELEDGMVITGPTRLRGATCRAHGDHRIAMALAIAGLVADGATDIEGVECVNVSFPRFAEVFSSALKG